MNSLTRSECAFNAFKSGYNCAQSVAISFSDKLGMEVDQIAKLTSGFGGGMGRLRETCGAISGAVFVVSALYGYDDKSAVAEKAQLYSDITGIGEAFRTQFGTLNCSSLLKNIQTTLGSIPEARTEKYYEVRPCVHFVMKATELVEEFIEKKEKENI